MSDFPDRFCCISSVPKLGSVRIQQILAHLNIELVKFW